MKLSKPCAIFCLTALAMSYAPILAAPAAAAAHLCCPGNQCPHQGHRRAAEPQPVQKEHCSGSGAGLGDCSMQTCPTQERAAATMDNVYVAPAISGLEKVNAVVDEVFPPVAQAILPPLDVLSPPPRFSLA